MRDERVVLVITAHVNKQLQTNAVGVVQTKLCTEWRFNGKGWCVCDVSQYPPKHISDSLIRYFTPPKPVRIKKNEDD